MLVACHDAEFCGLNENVPCYGMLNLKLLAYACVSLRTVGVLSSASPIVDNLTFHYSIGVGLFSE